MTSSWWPICPGSNHGSSLSTSSASSEAPTSGDVDIDEEWAQIATILSSVKFEAEGIEEGSTYSKEFEQTFFKIMTGWFGLVIGWCSWLLIGSNWLPGKPKKSIHGWLHRVGLGQYEDVLVGNGFDDAEFLVKLPSDAILRFLICIFVVWWNPRREGSCRYGHLKYLPSSSDAWFYKRSSSSSSSYITNNRWLVAILKTERLFGIFDGIDQMSDSQPTSSITSDQSTLQPGLWPPHDPQLLTTCFWTD